MIEINEVIKMFIVSLDGGIEKPEIVYMGFQINEIIDLMKKQNHNPKNYMIEEIDISHDDMNYVYLEFKYDEIINCWKINQYYDNYYDFYSYLNIEYKIESKYVGSQIFLDSSDCIANIEKLETIESIEHIFESVKYHDGIGEYAYQKINLPDNLNRNSIIVRDFENKKWMVIN